MTKRKINGSAGLINCPKNVKASSAFQGVSSEIDTEGFSAGMGQTACDFDVNMF